MHISFVRLAMLASFVVFGRAEDGCDDGPDAAPFAPGRVGGQAFPAAWDYQMSCECRWKGGDSIVGIEAWSAQYQIKAVRFKFARTGWTDTHGDIPDDEAWQHDIQEWNAGEEVCMYSKICHWGPF